MIYSWIYSAPAVRCSDIGRRAEPCPRLPARSRRRSQHASRLRGLIVGCEAGLGCERPGLGGALSRRADAAREIRGKKKLLEPILAVELLDALSVDSRCAWPGRAFSSGPLGRRVAAAAAVNMACGGLTAKGLQY